MRVLRRLSAPLHLTLTLGVAVGLASACAVNDGDDDSAGDDAGTSSMDSAPGDDDAGTSMGTEGSGAEGDSADGADSSDSGGTPTCDDGVSTNAALLLPYLQEGGYLGLLAESAVHDSAGPHFGDVRTYVGDCLADSLEAGAAQHPVGAAAVKELYGSGGTVQGWAVMVKAEDVGGGDGWYWYEWYQGNVYGGTVDDATCVGCHAAGIDGVRSPWPLQ